MEQVSVVCVGLEGSESSDGEPAHENFEMTGSTSEV